MQTTLGDKFEIQNNVFRFLPIKKTLLFTYS